MTATALPRVPETLSILIVDDEPDMRVVTSLTLKAMKLGARPVRLLTAGSGEEAVRIMRAQPDVAVILLDVVMESPTAGLDACRAIRGELKNPFVRILLCTGQPGAAPEREVIETYDIDGYLAKGEYTVNRMYTTVRSALKAYVELLELDRHRRFLAAIDECGQSLHSFEPLPVTLRRVLETAALVCPGTLAVARLETFAANGDPQELTLAIGGDDPVLADAAASEVVRRLAADPGALSRGGPESRDGDVLVPLIVHRDLGHGYVYLAGARLDDLSRRCLSMLAAHASNAIYSSVAQAMLAGRQGPVFEEMAI